MPTTCLTSVYGEDYLLSDPGQVPNRLKVLRPLVKPRADQAKCFADYSLPKEEEGFDEIRRRCCKGRCLLFYSTYGQQFWCLFVCASLYSLKSFKFISENKHFEAV